MEGPKPAFTPVPFVSGSGTVLWVIWLTYGSFYFCRQNISAAVPGLKDSGLNPVEIG
jgi:sugar phosphate permease